MGTNAALITRKVIDNSFEVLSIQLMTVLQAIDYLGCQDKLSSASHNVYADVRAIFPKFVEDLPKYKDAKKIKDYLETTDHVIPFE